MAKLGSALTADRFEAQKMVREAVSNASNLAEAMECVGAMYGIPSSNILVDDSLKTVKVLNDNIVCPSNVPADSNINTIMRSIGVVLDQISSRISNKIDNIQMANIEKGKESDEVVSRSDPSKGKVVATHKDANGDLVLVYDSGIIDAPHTPAGFAKAKELRESGNIPSIDPLPKQKPSYFTDEDDLMNGVDEVKPQQTVEYCLADMIGESAYYIDAMSRFDDTPNLGHSILTYHGYDCIRPTMDLFQEAKTKDVSGGGNVIKPEDLKHMKFDNSKIIKAIECFNKARQNQDNVKHTVDIDIETLVRDTDYQQGVKYLEDQFNCQLAIKWIKDHTEEDVFTYIFRDEYRTKLTISKSKGFQLGGANIDVFIIGKGITGMIADKPELFGQHMTAIFLHEIFHNIAGIMRYENAQFLASLSVAIEEASESRNPKAQKLIIDKYVNAFNNQCKGKLGIIGKKLMSKRLLAIVAAKSDIKLRQKYADALDEDGEKNSRMKQADRDLSRLISQYKYVKKSADSTVNSSRVVGKVAMVASALAAIAGIIGSIAIAGPAASTVFSIMMGISGTAFMTGLSAKSYVSMYENMARKYARSKELEEYYCDLMASMYQLPQQFFIGGGIKNVNYSHNEVSQKKLDEWVKIEKIVYETIQSNYPTTSERSWAGVTIAKKLLECEGLNKSIKAYLEWIVENNDNLLKTNIEHDYNKHTFDPKRAQDLDAHLHDLVNDSGVEVTEATIGNFADSTEFSEWLANGLVYDEDDITIQEMFEIENEYGQIMLEMELSTKATGYKDESTIKRILMFIPRLMMNLVEIVTRFIRGLGRNISNGIAKKFMAGKTYKVKGDIVTISKGCEFENHIIGVAEQYMNGVSSLNEYLERLSKIKEHIENSNFNGDYPDIDYYSQWGDANGGQQLGDIRKLKSEDPGKIDSDYHKETTLDGKEIVDAIVSINKTGNQLIPRVNKLLNQYKRLSKDPSFKIDALTPEQKKGLNILTGLIRNAYQIYILAYRFVRDVEKEQVNVSNSSQENTPIVCSNCGTTNKPGSIYCKQCGYKLKQDAGDVSAPSENNVNYDPDEFDDDKFTDV
jgi:hypothetical protein